MDWPRPVYSAGGSGTDGTVKGDGGIAHPPGLACLRVPARKPAPLAGWLSSLVQFGSTLYRSTPARRRAEWLNKVSGWLSCTMRAGGELDTTHRQQHEYVPSTYIVEAERRSRKRVSRPARRV